MKNQDDKTYLINLIVGDWSCDGHQITDTVTIYSNLPKKAIEKAYAEGVKKCGVDLVADICEAYEDSSIKKEDLDKLNKSGIDLKKISRGASIWEKGEDGSVIIGYEEFYKLYLAIAKLGNDTLVAKQIDAESINIGGYGLFHI